MRTDLAAALGQGLDRTRTEVLRALDRDQRDLALAHRQIDGLRRELAEARAAWESGLAELRTARTAPPSGADAGPSTGPEPAPEPAAEAATAVASVPAADTDARTEATESAEPTEPAAPKETALSAPSDPTPDPLPGPASTPTDSTDYTDSTEQQAAAGLLSELTCGRQPAPEPAAVPAPAVPAPAVRPDRLRDQLDAELSTVLRTAAQIGTAELVCHPHAWQFIVARAAGAKYFQLPPAATDEKSDMVTVRLSGPSLMSAVHALYTTYWETGTGPARDLQDSAMALAYYVDLSHEIRRTLPADSTAAVDERPPTRIVIDHRPSAQPA
ncbi:hypothetical protein [Kitasatospora sp. SolWspMP-SS2h]|uniref:hypothetical protein n=1 Tax=Kitasatospora sp. SolWspMP-SS2h TaxID=1305729 RepID=UPI000DBA5EF5|nr:hypothetical protein [Kitasatospora sp. SolWspMP-SS2h]